MVEGDNNRKEAQVSLIAATRELLFQIEEKEKRTAELIIANKELAFQHNEKAKRAAELAIANEELVFQSNEKAKRAAELVIANKELIFQNAEKEKRTVELAAANKSLLAFNYITSHDLQEPLRKILTFAKLLLETENENLSDKGKDYFRRMMAATERMKALNSDLLAYSTVNDTEHNFEHTDLGSIIADVKKDLWQSIDEKHATIDISHECPVYVIRDQFCLLMHNLLTNSIKFSTPGIPPHIIVASKMVEGIELDTAIISPDKMYCRISVADNGIGFEPKYKELIFDVFKKLHSHSDYEGTGMGLAIVKKIVENHNGIITATSELNKGVRFDIFLPVQ